MDDRQWIATTAFGGLVVSAFLYLPWIGGMVALLVVAAVQGAYLGWQTVPTSQFRLGGLSFAVGLFVSMPIMGILLSPSGPGNLWGMAAGFAIFLGLAVMAAVRLIRGTQSD